MNVMGLLFTIWDLERALKPKIRAPNDHKKENFFSRIYL